MSKELEDIRKNFKKGLQDLKEASQKQIRLERDRTRKIMIVTTLIRCGAIKSATELLNEWGKDE